MPTCAHGYPPGSCLICQTLGRTASPPDAVAPVAHPRRGGTPQGTGRSAPARRSRPGRLRTWQPAALLFGAVVAVIVLWAAVGVVWAILHLVELLAVAAATGWVGYRIGLARGRRGG